MSSKHPSVAEYPGHLDKIAGSCEPWSDVHSKSRFNSKTREHSVQKMYKTIWGTELD